MPGNTKKGEEEQHASNSQLSMTMEELVENYIFLVKKIALHLSAKMPSQIMLDDLIQSGMIGLIEAAQKFDASKGASFETYAGIRIRGAMLDEIRKGDWAPRSVHKNVRRITEAMRILAQRLGRDATDVELADHLSVSISEYRAMIKDSHSVRLLSLNAVVGEEGAEVIEKIPDDQGMPLDTLQSEDFKAQLIEAISSLPDREKLVLSFYYEEELNLKEIGAILGVSESRVSQLHGQAALRLRSKLSDWSRH